ncbi:putative late blight resistance protein homolog R1B-23 [Rhododendron vialii]|uniref:putative late blight resistance protein homolog R1B-23 n=1 Tax=Rhododendron vialii TaxID=182163 RepID=UPI00265E3076|nr:putative late blight resistance protein homolog R1B-23 [Rhododendron vialii]
MGDFDVDFFHENLKQLIMSSGFSSFTREKLESLKEEIEYMRIFLKVTEKKRNKHLEVINLVRQIKDVVFEAENIIERFVVQALKANQNWNHLSLDLESVKKKIKTLMAKVKQIYDENMYDINGVAVEELEHSFSKIEGGSSSSRGRNTSQGRYTSKVAEEKVVVGFKEEVMTLMGKLLDSGEGGRLEIISIVGAAGGGKTTLAKEVYDHRLTSHSFEIRAWVDVSQDYDKTMKGNLLIRILELVSPSKIGDYEKSSEDKLGEVMHKCLKGKKYLIVLDDIWGIEAWNDIQRSLPKECNGSKVLFTSRLPVEPNSIRCVPHYLAPLPESRSWELLEKKVFGKKCCPLELVGIGEHIAKKCEGLPLAIVTIAGILEVKDKTLDLWEEVSKSLSSIIAKNQDSCMKILELSYNYLPLHLKACFVYIAGFPEDSEILVRELIWFWIAEGFIQQSEEDKRLEDVAKDYLSSLIDRNLVMVARKRSFGGIKACRIHDLLRELCLKKAEEDNFLVQIYGNATFSPSAATKHRRLFVDSLQFFRGSSSSGGRNTSKAAEEKVVVGFKEEVVKLMGKLLNNRVGGPLEIISITGAAGGGKTTLAREVYDHPTTLQTFEIRVWVNVSQDYDKTMKRDLLIRILESASSKKHGDYEKSSEDKLGEETKKCLKGKKYLIVMDDIWDIEAWNDIQRSFPKENCKDSKVLFTSRLPVEPNSIHCVPHYLAPLPESRSWELLEKKVFGKKFCPPELVGIGERIAKKCGGLPLGIVAIAGILKVEDKTLDVWEKVSKRLSSIIAKNKDGCMKILELSYNHLPLHLKACFVYVGGFPKDSEILVRELIWLWIAEGFIQQIEGDKHLEDVAKDYLRNLIDRNLVMVARKRSFGGIKACRIHDLLRELCLKKAEEDTFLLQIYKDTSLRHDATYHRRLFIGSRFFRKYFSFMPRTQNLRSLLCLVSRNSTFKCPETNLAFFVDNFELLRVLCFISDECEGDIAHLVHLRFLALNLPVHTSNFVSPFSNLFNLETLYLQARSIGMNLKTILLPRDTFKMVKLRHLYAKGGVFKYHLSRGRNPDVAAGINFDPSLNLDSLQTLHPICPCEKCRNFLVRTPKLRKLGFHGELISNAFVLMLPDLEFLNCLETLSFNQCRIPNEATTLPPELKFPPTVTRLTLGNTCLKWEELSILQTLPFLEVLKLLERACRGPIWIAGEVEEGFSQLKYLRLQDLDIKEWNAVKDPFPRLEVLVVNHCTQLKQIPIEFANLNELCKIDVIRCSRSAETSAKEILEVRRNARGDDDGINLLAKYNYY